MQVEDMIKKYIQNQGHSDEYKKIYEGQIEFDLWVMIRPINEELPFDKTDRFSRKDKESRNVTWLLLLALEECLDTKSVENSSITDTYISEI